jgi:pyruvate formate lyase activating enzyme
MDSLMSRAGPEAIAKKAQDVGCSMVAFTYNDPVVFHEYAIDTASACQELGIKSVAVSAGYICQQPRAEFYRWMQAANIDLKAFSERFYHKITGGHLAPVLDTLQYICHETSVWLEITTLIIPGENDAREELEAMTQWVVEHLGKNVPMHFSAFHPDWKMRDKPHTTRQSLLLAREIALNNGVRYVYVGNVHAKLAASTYCHACGELLIGRDRYTLHDWNLDEGGRCDHCGEKCAGHFSPKPAQWGAKRVAVRMN